MIITGEIKSVVFRNEDNGYTVAKLNSSGEVITVVGEFSSANQGERVQLEGDFIKNSKYGEQFKVVKVKNLPPDSLQGIKRYLASGLIKGVGEKTAEKIVNKFEDATLEIIEFNPQKLSEVNGISSDKAIKIAQAYKAIKKMQEAVMFLQGYKISTNLALKIYDKYKGGTETVLKTNPYKLVEDIDGVGFLTADIIAQKLGIEKTSPFRLRAGIIYMLKDSADKKGHTYLPHNVVKSEVLKLLAINENELEIKFDEVLGLLSKDKHLYFEKIENKDAVVHSMFHSMENEIAEKLVLLKKNSLTGYTDFTQEIENYEKVNKIKLHEDQINALKVSGRNGVSIVTGGPGTGKTTIIKALIDIFKAQKKEVALLAPTGRAAKKLEESTECPASTIHRGLGVGFGNNLKFEYNEYNRLAADVIIVDEISMIDVPLMFSLLKAIKAGAIFVMVGDMNQLPSVGAGNVLFDIIRSEVIPVVTLTKIYRQGKQSLIVHNAHRVNDGKMPIIRNEDNDFFFQEKTDATETMRTIVNLVVSRLPKFLSINPFNIQVLSPVKNGVCGVDNLNKNLQQHINAPSKSKKELRTNLTIFRQGDKVMQITNDYNQEWNKNNSKGEGVFNGDIGVIKDVNFDNHELTVEFEDLRVTTYKRSNLKNLVLAYAITIHKSQGSEFDVVIMPTLGGAPGIMTRNLLYTGITRAKKMMVIVGRKFYLRNMIRNNYTQKRYTLLSYKITRADEKLNA